MYTVYILQSLQDKRSYVGYTNNFERRFYEHNTGKSKSTKFRAPFRVLLTEEFATISEAKRREIWWKSGAGRNELRKIFEQIQ